MGPLNLAPRAFTQIRVPSTRPGIWKVAGIVVFLIAIGSLLMAAAIVTGLLDQFPLSSELPASAGPAMYQITTIVEQGTRRIYPYSIVPGGAETIEDAKRALADPRVRAACPGIDLAKLRQVRLQKNFVGYISYRADRQIYWTSYLVTVRFGETAFTDGVHLIRGQGLNCFSPLPMLPMRADEPSEEAMETPTEVPVIAYSFARFPITAPHLPPRIEELTPSFPFFPTAVETAQPLIPPIRSHLAAAPR